jgi:hypothetical protein
VIGIVSFDHINIAVMKIDITGSMMLHFRRGPAAPLVSKKWAQIESTATIFLRGNQGSELLFGGIAPIAVSAVMSLIQTVDVSEAIFPDHGVLGYVPLPHEIGFPVLYGQFSLDNKAFVHSLSFTRILSVPKKP